jgi:hypothetical protein
MMKRSLRKVVDLKTFFRVLSAWERQPPLELVAPWNARDMAHIKLAFKRAIRRAGNSPPLHIDPSISPQSLGYRLASYLVTHLNLHLTGFRISVCPGRGYPDFILARISDGRAFVLEVKAPKHFDKSDGNRIALTCRTDTLRRCFKPPICHLLATMLFRREGSRVWVKCVRLDFLQPSSPVNIRLEVSLNQRLLARRSTDFTWLSWSEDVSSLVDTASNGIGHHRAVASRTGKRHVSARQGNHQRRRRHAASGAAPGRS